MKTKFEKEDGWIKVPVDLKVYSLQSVHSAGYVFMDRAHVRLEEEKKDQVAAWLKPKKEDQDLEKLASDFCDELLNYAHYFSSLKTNAENMKTLLQRALFSASPPASAPRSAGRPASGRSAPRPGPVRYPRSPRP